MLHCSASGAGRPVMLIHSGGLSSRQWRRLATALEPHRRVLVPDLLGYGASGAWPDGAPFHFSRDVDALLELAEAEREPLDLVGHSYGGFLALKVALARPLAVRSLALYEPVSFGVLAEDERALLPDLPDYAGDGEAWLRAFVDNWNGEGAWEALSADVRAAFRAVAWKLSREVLTLADDRTPASAYRALSVPTLLLNGALTPEFERRVVRRLHEAIAGARHVELAGAGHMGPITHAAIVNERIVAHVTTDAPRDA